MKRTILLLTLCFFICNQSMLFSAPQGQALIDSLLIELPKAKEDSNKVYMLNTISFEYRQIDPQKGLEYGGQGLELIKKINWNDGLAMIYNTIGTHHSNMGDSETAIEYFNKSLDIELENGNKRSAAGKINNIATIFRRMGQTEKALEYLNRALKINEEVGNMKWKGINLINIADIYTEKAEYYIAIEKLHKASLIFRGSDEKYLNAVCKLKIGLIYKLTKEYEDALKFYNESLEIIKELGLTKVEALLYSSIGGVYTENKNFEKALEYNKKALKIQIDLNIKYDVAATQTKVAFAYEHLSEFEKALHHYSEALLVSKEIQVRGIHGNNLTFIGQFHLSLTGDSILAVIAKSSQKLNLDKLYNLNQALSYSLEGSKIAEEIGDKRNLVTAYATLHKVYKQKGDYKKGYEYQEKLIAVKADINDEDKSKEIGRLEAKHGYEVEEKDKRIAAEKLAEELIQRNNIQYSSIAILTLLAFLVLFILSKKKISLGVIDVMTFISFLLIYEFLLVVTEPFVDDFTNQIPIYKLMFNICLALIFIPLHIIEDKFKKRYREKQKNSF